MLLDIETFRRAYRQAVDEVLPFLTDERLAVVARHNPGWRPGAFDFASYLRASEVRYVAALESYARHGGADAAGDAGATGGLSTLEVGGFMAAFPLALARMGARAALSEKYGYYYGAFDELRGYVADQGVEVWDLDLTEPVGPLPRERFDLITALAILEHLPHSPRVMLEQCRDLLAPTGRLVIEVPNIAYWPRRLGMLQGVSPLPPIADVFHAEIPFTGHHREYTESELRAVLGWSGMLVDDLTTYNYTPSPRQRLHMRLLHDMPRRRFRSMRELLLACARRADGGHR
jgi:SAM-dependent methyltransferase